MLPRTNGRRPTVLGPPKSRLCCLEANAIRVEVPRDISSVSEQGRFICDNENELTSLPALAVVRTT
jgi:hypothetical protein